MRFSGKLIIFAWIAALAATMASAADIPDGVPVKINGGVLTTLQGMTLYTFKRDEGGRVMCNHDCVKFWPPLVATAGAKTTGDFTLYPRSAKVKQWVYKGQPLYTSVLDTKPGDTNGDGKNESFYVARP